MHVNRIIPLVSSWLMSPHLPEIARQKVRRLPAMSWFSRSPWYSTLVETSKELASEVESPLVIGFKITWKNIGSGVGIRFESVRNSITSYFLKSKLLSISKIPNPTSRFKNPNPNKSHDQTRIQLTSHKILRLVIKSTFQIQFSRLKIPNKLEYLNITKQPKQIT